MESLANFLQLKGKNIILILDYDGTLTEIIDKPKEATLSKERKSLIEQLNSKENISILINSGRPMDELLLITDQIKTDLMANHGLFFKEKTLSDPFQTIEQKELED